MTPRLSVRELTVSYGPHRALSRVSVEVGAGERLGVVGPNGAGKSTLLKAIVGLITPDEGAVAIDGRPVGRALRKVAYLPQRAEIDWTYPAQVREVVRMGCYARRGLLRRPREEERGAVRDALERMGMAELARRPIGALSAGQQQRVFLARALAQRAALILLDEPYAAVDAVTERLIDQQLSHAAAAGTAIVVVNHDLASVSRRYDRVALLNRELVAVGDAEDALRRDRLERAYGSVPLLADDEVSG